VRNETVQLYRAIENKLLNDRPSAYWHINGAEIPNNIKTTNMKKKSFVSFLLMACFIICFAAADGISGKWNCTVQLQDGNTYPVVYDFTVSGKSLTGTVLAGDQPKEIKEGKINGTDFTFSIADDDSSAIPHTGKYYASGDSIAITAIYRGATIHTRLTRAAK
jgi:hypothetical protein